MYFHEERFKEAFFAGERYEFSIVDNPHKRQYTARKGLSEYFMETFRVYAFLLLIIYNMYNEIQENWQKCEL